MGLLVIENANPLCSWRFGVCLTAGLGSLLLSPGSPHVLHSLSPHGAVLIWWDILFIQDRAFCQAGAVNNGHKVHLNLLETLDDLHGGWNAAVQCVPGYRDHIF